MPSILPAPTRRTNRCACPHFCLMEPRAGLPNQPTRSISMIALTIPLAIRCTPDTPVTLRALTFETSTKAGTDPLRSSDPPTLPQTPHLSIHLTKTASSTATTSAPASPKPPTRLSHGPYSLKTYPQTHTRFPCLNSSLRSARRHGVTRDKRAFSPMSISFCIAYLIPSHLSGSDQTRMRCPSPPR